MSHQVETMIWLKQVPWHGLGQEITEKVAYSIHDSIKAAGLNWEVITKQCFIEFDDEPTSDDPEVLFTPSYLQAVPAYATIRTKDNKVLGVVGERFEVLQNIEAFKLFQPFLDSGLVRLNTAGSLDEGRKIWILAEILSKESLEIRPNDFIRKFILLSHGHDGKSMVKFGLTPIRVVCYNTLSMAHSDKESQLFKVKHTQNMISSLNDIRDVIQKINMEYENTITIYRFLAAKRINKEQLEEYIKTVFNVKEEKISTRQYNILEKVKSYFTYAPGAEGKSYWDAFNSITYYFSHEYGNNANNRLSSLWFGINSEKIKFALKVALKN